MATEPGEDQGSNGCEVHPSSAQTNVQIGDHNTIKHYPLAFDFSGIPWDSLPKGITLNFIQNNYPHASMVPPGVTVPGEGQGWSGGSPPSTRHSRGTQTQGSADLSDPDMTTDMGISGTVVRETGVRETIVRETDTYPTSTGTYPTETDTYPTSTGTDPTPNPRKRKRASSAEIPCKKPSRQYRDDEVYDSD